ncbi:MAG: NAD-dependent epimerase/dehydratase family protein [Bacteroidales bacterium]|nr:NAD-dependent epimerase/dehydratase family protein [Bacteroidales bacterium]
MKNVLVIGSTGQIGSELTMALRKVYHQGRIVAGYIPGSAPTGDLLESGPAEQANVCNAKQIADIVDKYYIDTIYNLAALLSATAERLPLKAWDIQMNGLINVLEVAREKRCAVFTPSSIGSFGPDTPRDNTPQDTIQRPTSMYGVTKVATELLSDYYYHKFGVDTRSVRFPGLISYKTLPGGGTTDYAVEIYYAAVKGEEFVCPLAHGTYLDMMYMPDAIKAAIKLMEADPRYLVHRNAFNITSMSFDPEGVYDAIRKHIPTFKMRYEVDPVRQAIADSWPNRMDDVCARKEWGWTPSYNLESMTRDMLKHLRVKLHQQ